METKSPLKDKPLRNPGQKLDEELQEIRNDKIIPYVLFPGFVLIIAIIEIMHKYFNYPLTPGVYLLLFLISALYSVYKILKIKKHYDHLKLGRDGEKAVGQYLELLREKGAKVFHDVQGKDFNLDHVVISSKGIFVIETKTYCKPAKGEAIIKYDGENVFLYGKTPDRNPIVQVSAASNWLRDELNNSTGRKIDVKPVVVFPGWFIETTKEAKACKVWVLNPKALPSYMDNTVENLKSEDVHLLSNHLSRYIRTYNN